MVSAKCVNCGFNQETIIPRGVLISEWFKSENSVCDNCGCNALKRKMTSELREELMKANKRKALAEAEKKRLLEEAYEEEEDQEDEYQDEEEYETEEDGYNRTNPRPFPRQALLRDPKPFFKSESNSRLL